MARERDKELTEHWRACIVGIAFVHLQRRHTSSKEGMREGMCKWRLNTFAARHTVQARAPRTTGVLALEPMIRGDGRER